MHGAARGLLHLRVHVDFDRVGRDRLDRHRDLFRPQPAAKLTVVGRSAQVCQKSPTSTIKEPYIYPQVCQKSPTSTIREPYITLGRDLVTRLLRSCMSKEPYVSHKRALYLLSGMSKEPYINHKKSPISTLRFAAIRAPYLVRICYIW